MKKIDVMVTAFRDGFQSAYGARVLTDDYLPALEAAAEAGLHHFEIGGGARFQSLYFYANEDAFAMMDASRAAVGPEANLQTLARGISVVGLDSQSSDIIDLHAVLFKKHGVTTIRNFDALNDIENLNYSGRAIQNAGLNHEICVTLMGLPPGVSGAHDEEFYTGKLQEILDSGIPFDSVCYKDASGTATPETVYRSIKEARRRVPPEIPIRFHTHETAGTSVICYKAALDAGAVGIDLSLAPVSGGTSQPDLVIMWHALRGTEYDLDVDIEKVMEAEALFKHQMRDYFLPPEAAIVEPMIPFSPMPGGALTANTQMMRDAGTLDRFPEIIAAMREVVKRGGFGTSVTPVSQFYFQQAFNNVMFGPWKKIGDGYGKMVLGYFGRTPLPPDPEVVKLAEEQLKLPPTTENPRDINDRDTNKGRSAAEAQLRKEGIEITDENVFIAATCLEKGIAYLKGEAKRNIRKKDPDDTSEAGSAAAAGPRKGPAAYTVRVAGKSYTVSVDGNTATIGSRQIAVSPGDAVPPRGPAGTSAAATPVRSAAPVANPRSPAPTSTQSSAPAGTAPARSGAATKGTSVTAALPGTILRVDVTPGQEVSDGECLLILEAMKMQTEVFAPAAGVVQEVLVSAGEQVQSDQELLRLA